MTQITIQQALSDFGFLHDQGKRVQDVPLKELLRPWLVVTGLEWREAVDCSVGQIWRDLQVANQGVSSYLKVMGEENPVDLREFSCRLIGRFTVMGEDIRDENVTATTRLTITFENGAWFYVSDTKLRLRDSRPTFSEALHEVRQILLAG